MPWKIDVSEDLARVRFKFDGLLTGEEGVASADAYRRALTAGPKHVVWDLTSMSGYESGARQAWQEVMWPLRKQMKSLKVVGASGLARVGATFLAIMMGVRWEMADREDG